jgi:hypothetical protein
MTVAAHALGIAWVELANVSLGVSTQDVAGIRDVPREGDTSVDLDARFGVPAGRTDESRTIELRSGGALRTRAEVRVELLADEDRFDLPEFFADWARARGLVRIARRESGFGFLIEPGPFLAGLGRDEKGENDVTPH